MSNASNQLVAWGLQHPRLAEQIDLFAKARFAKAAKVKYSHLLSMKDRQRKEEEQYRLAEGAARILTDIRTEMEKRHIATAQPEPVREAADLLSEDRPDPDLSEYDLALSEQELKEYESVIRRADRAIEAARSWRSSDDLAEDNQREETLYKWCRLRARAFTKRAERLRTDGSKAAREQALKDLASAFRDLTDCSRFATKRNSSLETHSVERVRAEALMTRVEIDIDLGQLGTARGHLKYAREGLRSYADIARVVDRRYELKEFYKRIDEIEARLRREEAKKSRGSGDVQARR
jgi:hypothetical protein